MTKEQQRENRRKWVEALRSGEFEQAQGALALGDQHGQYIRYCCLGVACEIAARNGLTVAKDYRFGVGSFDGETTTLPASVQEWVGLRTDEGRFGTVRGSTLAAQNDTGASFSKIADIIESEPEGLTKND